MAHGYHNLQLFNQWLTHHYLGEHLLETESNLLASLLNRHFGKHALLLGVPHQFSLLKATEIPCHSLLTPLSCKEKLENTLEGDFDELPIQTGSIDLVMLPHILEFVDNPRQLLSEACRIVKPEGLIAVCGFNPYSSWGLKRNLTKRHTAPWIGNFLAAHTVNQWLTLADFIKEKQTAGLFRPPLKQKMIFEKLRYIENLGQICFPFLGGIYIIIARASIISLTPIRLKWKWKQGLSGIKISTPMSGPIARQSK